MAEIELKGVKLKVGDNYLKEPIICFKTESDIDLTPWGFEPLSEPIEITGEWDSPEKLHKEMTQLLEDAMSLCEQKALLAESYAAKELSLQYPAMGIPWLDFLTMLLDQLLAECRANSSVTLRTAARGGLTVKLKIRAMLMNQGMSRGRSLDKAVEQGAQVISFVAQNTTIEQFEEMLHERA